MPVRDDRQGNVKLTRRAVLGVLAAGAAGLLAACGGAATPAPPTAPPTAASAQQAPAASKKLGGELRLHVRTGAEEDTLKDVLPKFTQDTGVTVKLESYPTAEYFTKLQTLIAGGSAGDVWWCAYRNTPRFANSKVIMQLDDLVKADNFDLTPYYSAALQASSYKGGDRKSVV
jgi:multiple sugar transport system substrate-binding protein